MKTAVDTNILLDILTDDREHGDASEVALRESVAAGPVVACPVVVAETLGWFSSAEDARGFFYDVGVTEDALGWPCLMESARVWQTYTKNRRASLTCPRCGTNTLVSCPQCGASLRIRQHILSDFLIGGHALHQADRLLTRDRGFYGAYFANLVVYDPSVPVG
ncbi:MAG: hypothetical protein M0Z54_16880 [Thermaerobacter sp.]|nr:hypothetical protein [Thermaerobacter sp.]